MLPRVVLFSLIAAGCGNKPPEPVPLGPETCDNKKDDNGDGKVDCADPKCFKATRCLGATEVCDNGLDDNSDGQVDCNDPLCNGQGCGIGCVCIALSPSENNCGDAVDNDFDQLTDCADPDCSQAIGCSDGGGGTGGGNPGTGGGNPGTGGGNPGTGGGGAAGTGGGGAVGTGGGAAGTGGGGAAGGGGGGAAGVGGGGAAGVGGGGAAPMPEQNCADNVDNDGDNKTDCDDPDCVTRSCGMGCTCVLNRRVEMSCSDGADNDNDGKADCLDTDCIGVGTENCADGVDNTCDRAVDCGDTKCVGSGACNAQVDGKGCTANNQCAGGRCLTEPGDHAPNGMCTNISSCTVNGNTGCNGGICTETGAFDSCRARCTGNGLTGQGCRAGYTCYDPDVNNSNNNSGCVILCSSDAECSGNGTGWGCNTWSRICELKDKGKPKYGASCTADSQCESDFCDTSIGTGYCYGICRGDTKACGLDGVCDYDSSFGDNVGYCMDACSTTNSSAQCTNPQNLCRNRNPALMCTCGTTFEFCVSNANCCSGSCGFSVSNFCD